MNKITESSECLCKAIKTKVSRNLGWVGGAIILLACAILSIVYYTSSEGSRVANLLTACFGLLSAHIAFFVIAWAQYEFECSRQAQRVNLLTAMLGQEDYKAIAPRLAEITQKKILDKPHLFYFKQIYGTVMPLLQPKMIDDQETKEAVANILRGKPDWAGADFSDLNLSDLRLQEIHFADTKLWGANFSNARCKDVFFPNAELGYAKFSQTLVVGGSFINVTLCCTEFAGTRLHGVDLHAFKLLRSTDNEPYTETIEIDDDFQDEHVMQEIQECFSSIAYAVNVKVPKGLKDSFNKKKNTKNNIEFATAFLPYIYNNLK